MDKEKPIHPLAITAIKGLHDNDFEETPGMCQRYQRQCVQHTYGSRFNQFHKSNADESGRAWSKSEFAKPGGAWGVVGDIYYWFATEGQPDGHTAIRIPGNKVAENSTAHRKTGNGKGVRSLSELRRKPDLIVRLPGKVGN
jgi:hypothetical protein